MNFGRSATAQGRGMTFIVAFAQAMADPLQEWITALAELHGDHIAIIGVGPVCVSMFVGIALATMKTWIVLGMPGARGDPVRRHAVGARRHVPEPTVHLMDKSALDRQPPPRHATQMTAQHSQVRGK